VLFDIIAIKYNLFCLIPAYLVLNRRIDSKGLTATECHFPYRETLEKAWNCW